MPGFDEQSAKRISDVVRRVETIPVNALPEPIGPRILQPGRNAKTTTVITARSGVTKGQGTCDLYCDKGDGSGVDRLLMSGVKVWNPYSTSIPPATWVTLRVVDGLNQIVGSDCS